MKTDLTSAARKWGNLVGAKGSDRAEFLRQRLRETKRRVGERQGQKGQGQERQGLSSLDPQPHQRQGQGESRKGRGQVNAKLADYVAKLGPWWGNLQTTALYSLGLLGDDSADSLFILSKAVVFRGSSLGDYNFHLDSLSRESASGFEPYKSMLGDLLPIALSDVVVGKSCSALESSAVKAVVGCLIFLFGVGWTPKPIFPRSLNPVSPAQLQAVERFAARCNFSVTQSLLPLV